LKLNSQIDSCMHTTIQDKSWLWHFRFGHFRFKTLSHMYSKNIVEGMPLIELQETVCEGCTLGKHHRNSFPVGRSWRASHPLELVHSDLCDPMHTTSIGGNRYFLTFIDDYSKKTWVFFLKEKLKVYEYFKSFKALVERESGFPLKTLRTDRESEYVGCEFKAFLKENGIRHQFTARNTPQQSGVVERKNRTIKELARSMLKEKSVPSDFWAESMTYAIYLLNKASSKLQDQTPQEVWSGHKLSMTHLRVFDNIVYSYISDERRKKLDNKSKKCIFVGYSEHCKA